MMSSLRGGDDRPPWEGAYIYVLTLLLGYIIADLTLLKVRPMMLPTQAPPAYNPTMKPIAMISRQDFNPITDRNLFNADGIIPPALSTKDQGPGVNENAPAVLSQLPIKLEGTIVHFDARRSVATVTVQAKNETQAFMLDDEIGNMAKITKIERRKLTFRNLNNNRLEYIEIPKDSTLTFGLKNNDHAGTEEINKAGEFEFTLNRATLNKYTSDLPSILNQARVVPNIVPGSGGRVDGYRFVSIQQNSIYETLGFKSGDVIKEVNGEPVNSPTKAMELYNALRSEARIKLMIEREGRNQDFSYEVKD